MAALFAKAGPIPSNIVFNENFDKLVEKAISDNIHHGRTKNRMFKWISSVISSRKYKGKILLYDKSMLIYMQDTIVTVYKVPRNLLPIGSFIK